MSLLFSSSQSPSTLPSKNVFSQESCLLVWPKYIRFSRSWYDKFSRISALVGFVIRDSPCDLSVTFHLKHLYSSLFIIHVSDPYRADGLCIVCFDQLFFGVYFFRLFCFCIATAILLLSSVGDLVCCRLNVSHFNLPPVDFNV